ncbi:MAG: TetR/AcrR family transcriptional regulator [Phyllobacteriaceae bacterium]|nr:TetR/AcrR family transcriptional regulator [Phyllobacteriaceae bacterium]
MRYAAGHKEEARARLIEAAGRGFRRKGFGGIGVDGLAKEAGLTSGAFYGHFASKDAAFETTVAKGIGDLADGVRQFRETKGRDWLPAFVDFYLGEKRTCDLAESCAMQSLSAEVLRAEGGVRAVYREAMEAVAELVADGLPGDDPLDRRRRAWAILAALAGGVTLARAVDDPALAEVVVAGVRAAVSAVGAG